MKGPSDNDNNCSFRVHLLTSGQVGARGWWHKRRVHPWRRLWSSLSPHYGTGRMWPGTSPTKPSEMPFLVWGLTCGPEKHDAFKRKQEDSIYKLYPRLLCLKPTCGQTWSMKAPGSHTLLVIHRWLKTVSTTFLPVPKQSSGQHARCQSRSRTSELLALACSRFEHLCRPGDSLSINKAQRIEIRLFYSPTRLSSLGCTFGEVRNSRHQRETQSDLNSEPEVCYYDFPLPRAECTITSLWKNFTSFRPTLYFFSLFWVEEQNIRRKNLTFLPSL